MNVRALVKQALQYYPNSKHLRKQWVRKTRELIETNKHVMYGAPVGWKSFL